MGVPAASSAPTALTAREIGATLLTRDPSDYAAIQRVVDFSFVAV